jgi:hypothetical protein
VCVRIDFVINLPSAWKAILTAFVGALYLADKVIGDEYG